MSALYPTPGQIWHHAENGHAYTVTAVGKQKQPGGEWVPAVFYQRADGTPGVYAQALDGFLQRFGRVEDMALTLALKRAEEAEAQLRQIDLLLRDRDALDGLPDRPAKVEVLVKVAMVLDPQAQVAESIKETMREIARRQVQRAQLRVEAAQKLKDGL